MHVLVVVGPRLLPSRAPCSDAINLIGGAPDRFLGGAGTGFERQLLQVFQLGLQPVRFGQQHVVQVA